MRRAFFCNSGTEANEGAIKIARKWGRREREGAYEIISTDNAFHGRTLASMAASGKPGWDAMFPPPMPGFVKVPHGDAGAVERAITPRTAAILVEPIQGEAGVIVPPDGYLRALRDVATRKGVLLMFDEVQTGVGRTGTLFGFEHEGVIPDVMTLGKGLGAGVPLAALLTSERAGVFAYGEQGGTYNGNPLMTAVGCRVIEAVTAPGFLPHVRTAGEYLMGRLAALASEHGIRQVRGRGLLVALDLATPRAEALRDRCFELGLLVNAARPATIRLMPSLRVSLEEIDQMIAIFEKALTL